MIVNVNHSRRIKTFLAYNPFAMSKEPQIPTQHERHFELFEAIFDLARKDVLYAPVGSKRFESAAEWFTDSWYYTVLERFTDRVDDIKRHWQEVIAVRRDESETEGRNS